LASVDSMLKQLIVEEEINDIANDKILILIKKLGKIIAKLNPSIPPKDLALCYWM
jgi:hypothetical protein